MKLLHTKLARSIWLFDIRDLDPNGTEILGELIAWIKGRYKFASAPDPSNPVPTPTPPSVPASPQAQRGQAPGGLLFERGRFVTKEQPISITSLRIYDDGLVVDVASSTADGDLFLSDLMNGAVTQFRLAQNPDVPSRRLYLSELIFRSDMELEALNQHLTSFARSLPSNVGGGRTLPFRVGAIAFWSEPNDAGQHRLIRIERQISKPFSEQRFFSDAPLPTDEHFQVLERFEQLVLASKC